MQATAHGPMHPQLSHTYNVSDTALRLVACGSGSCAKQLRRGRHILLHRLPEAQPIVTIHWRIALGVSVVQIPKPTAPRPGTADARTVALDNTGVIWCTESEPHTSAACHAKRATLRVCADAIRSHCILRRAEALPCHAGCTAVTPMGWRACLTMPESS